MKPFRFSLQRVLNYRKRQEQGAQMELARRTRVRDDAREEFAAQEQRLEEAFGQWETLRIQGASDPLLWQGQSLYIGRVRREREQAEERWREAERRVGQARDLLVEAARNRKVLELLREKEATRHRQEMNRWETAQTDEINTFRFGFVPRVTPQAGRKG